MCASVLYCCQDLFCIVAFSENIFYEWFSLFEWTFELEPIRTLAIFLSRLLHGTQRWRDFETEPGGLLHLVDSHAVGNLGEDEAPLVL